MCYEWFVIVAWQNVAGNNSNWRIVDQWGNRYLGLNHLNITSWTLNSLGLLQSAALGPFCWSCEKTFPRTFQPLMLMRRRWRRRRRRRRQQRSWQQQQALEQLQLHRGKMLVRNGTGLGLHLPSLGLEKNFIIFIIFFLKWSGLSSTYRIIMPFLPVQISRALMGTNEKLKQSGTVLEDWGFW